MAGGIDTSNRKPRRLRGTPALKYINLYSFLTLTVSFGIGYYFYTCDKNKQIVEKYFSDADFERERIEKEERNYMLTNQLIGQKAASEIRQILRHKKKYDTEN